VLLSTEANNLIGIRECEIIQWFVEPEARVEEFDKICEVQSDKASVEITTRFTGVIKKLHYESGEMAIVGKPLVDIDVQEDVQEEDVLESPKTTQSLKAQEAEKVLETSDEPASQGKISKLNQDIGDADQGSQMREKGTHAALATPAVRHLIKELGVDIADVKGTGRDGRVLKEDVYKFSEARKGSPAPSSEPKVPQPTIPRPTFEEGPQKETIVQLSTVQAQMFKTMTRSLTIPHFLYADEIDFSNLSKLRHRLNKSLSKASPPNESTKLSFLPFIIKAVSLALHQHPVLNARVDLTAESFKPALAMRSQHNIGIAMATPSGLLVPVIKNASTLSIPQIASELTRLQTLANSNKLTSSDLTGGTITISNIGNIGGTYVSPVIVDSQVAILGMGKMRTVPAFAADGTVVPKQICNFSWSADHRVVDGAAMARAAEVVRGFVEEPDSMLVYLR
jgi:2-oxoisovalerate dehydrogenase E2 component (dihydrolipoyl transacylase)